jgi:hypothetical protein
MPVFREVIAMTIKLFLFLLTLAMIVAAVPTITFANAPGGDYVQCDPRNPSSPVRCKPDGW